MASPRFLLTVAAAGSFALGALAQEKAAPQNNGPTIDEAKREFQALKASRATPDQISGNLNLPKVDLPSPLPEAAPSPSAAAKKLKAEKAAQQKSKNWLLEAMAQTEKSKTTGSATDRKRAKEDLDADDSPLARSLDGEADPLDPTGELRDRSQRTEQLPAPSTLRLDNPLTPYMTGWISPRDHDVLLPKTSATPMLDASLAQLVDAPGALPATTAVTTAGPGFSPLPGTATGPADNPYLRVELPLPAPAATIPGTVLPGPAAGLPPELKAPTPEPVAPAKLAPGPADLSKPEHDAKYFPQLKRF